MIKWQETTKDRFHQDVSKKEIVSVKLKTPSLVIRVHRHDNFSEDVWLLTCYELDIRNSMLKSWALDHAKREALKIIKSMVGNYYHEMKDHDECKD